METGKFTYFILLFLSLLGPLVLSFDKKVHYYKRWRFLFPSILRAMVLFILWDVVFTRLEVWGFNEIYTVGWNIWYLPVEEWLFFLIIPFSCLFIFDVIAFYFPRLQFPANRFNQIVAGVLAVVLLVFSLWFRHRYYTFIVSLLTASYLILILIFRRRISWMPHFLIAYLIALVPFTIVNGILTSLPVVRYNPADNLGIRFMTIPLEDFIYLFLLLLMVTDFYQVLLKRSGK
jgi:lycopene cyclase domain-containing protein